MQTLEEKIKEIEELCQNLDESKIEHVYLDLKDKSIIKLHWVSGVELFELTYYNDYNNLIRYLKANQKEPKLYTMNDIFNSMNEYFKDMGGLMRLKNAKDYIKNHAKPYKKQSCKH